jgi:hypothetical protein
LKYSLFSLLNSAPRLDTNVLINAIDEFLIRQFSLNKRSNKGSTNCVVFFLAKILIHISNILFETFLTFSCSSEKHSIIKGNINSKYFSNLSPKHQGIKTNTERYPSFII